MIKNEIIFERSYVIYKDQERDKYTTLEFLKNKKGEIIDITEIDDYDNKNLFYIIKDVLVDIEKKEDESILYYRGQKANWQPVATLLRNGNNHLLEKEKKYYDKVRVEHDIELLYPHNDLHLFSKMQHYGFPTRFLDLTKNKYKALGFMTEGLLVNDTLDKSEEMYSCIYIFKANNYENKYLLTTKENQELNYNQKSPKFPIVEPVINQSLNQRIHAQEGLFIYFDCDSNEEGRIVDSYEIIEVLVDISHKSEVLEIIGKLEEYGYSTSDLYPDMEKRAPLYCKDKIKL